MENIKASVIGCGSWGKNHVRIYKELDNTDLTMIVDSNESIAKEVGQRYGVAWSTDPEDIFKRSDIKAVSICTPTITHTKLALKAIQAGKNVLVEKPITNTVKEAEQLVSAAKKANTNLAVGFVERFNPAVIEAAKLVANKKIGEVILVYARRVSRKPWRIGDVGVIKDLGIHDIDIITHIFNDQPEEVYTIAGQINHKFEDYANIMLRFKGDRNAFIETNWLTPQKVRYLIITGTEGLINVEYITQEVSIENEEQVYKPFIDNKEPLREELKSFIDSVRENTPPKVSGEDGIKTLKICEAALKSAR